MAARDGDHQGQLEAGNQPHVAGAHQHAHASALETRRPRRPSRYWFTCRPPVLPLQLDRLAGDLVLEVVQAPAQPRHSLGDEIGHHPGLDRYAIGLDLSLHKARVAHDAGIGLDTLVRMFIRPL